MEISKEKNPIISHCNLFRCWRTQRFRFDGTKWGILLPGCFCGIANADVGHRSLFCSISRHPFSVYDYFAKISFVGASVCWQAWDFHLTEIIISVLGMVALLIGGSILYPLRINWSLSIIRHSFCYFLLLHRQVYRIHPSCVGQT